MSKNTKKLLNESTIRRMMKLAEIDSLSETFITDKLTVKEGGMAYNRDDDEDGDDTLEEQEEEFDAPEGAVEEPEMPEEPMEEPMEEPGEEEMFEALQQEGIEIDDGKMQERLTNEIAKRVAARLVKESRQDKMADQLAERIMGRLAAKK